MPVVATRHAGIKDAILHGETGFLVEEGDFRSMADRMVDLAHDPGLAGKMGRKARAYISENYSMARSITRLWDIIKRAIDAKAGDLKDYV